MPPGAYWLLAVAKIGWDIRPKLMIVRPTAFAVGSAGVVANGRFVALALEAVVVGEVEVPGDLGGALDDFARDRLVGWRRTAGRRIGSAGAGKGGHNRAQILAGPGNSGDPAVGPQRGGGGLFENVAEAVEKLVEDAQGAVGIAGSGVGFRGLGIGFGGTGLGFRVSGAGSARGAAGRHGIAGVEVPCVG